MSFKYVELTLGAFMNIEGEFHDIGTDYIGEKLHGFGIKKANEDRNLNRDAVSTDVDTRNEWTSYEVRE